VDHGVVSSWYLLQKVRTRNYPVAKFDTGAIFVAIAPIDNPKYEGDWIRYGAKSDVPVTPKFSVFCGSENFFGGLLFRVLVTDSGETLKLELNSRDTKNGWFTDESERLSIHNDYSVRFRAIPLEVAIGVRLFCERHFWNT
jgi:hypothetical protein